MPELPQSYRCLNLTVASPLAGGLYSANTSFHEMSQLRNSRNTHEGHVPARMTPANSSAGGISTSQMVETRRDNNGEVHVESKSHGYALRSRSQLDLKDHIGFQCPVCPKTFDSLRGLRIHQRKCGRNSSSASDAPAMESSLLAVHQSSDGPVQHHNAVMWGYALTHGETKRPSALNDLKLRPRLKLPNSTDKKKWKSLDEEIYT